jgi:uncharacterized membrane protein
MSSAIICTTRSSFEIETLLARLKLVVSSAADISLLVADRPGSVVAVSGTRAVRRHGTAVARQAGGIAGGIFGLLAGAGILTIPGLGLFIAAGPIIAGLSGAAVGAAMGSISGALTGMGLSETDARRYENKVKEGSALLSIRTWRPTDLARVLRILEHSHAEDIAVVEGGASL